MEALRDYYLEIPIVTRIYTTLCILTTLAVHLELVSPLNLYFNPNLILRKFQIWRLLTTFLYFGSMGLSFFFNIIFTHRYCRMLEEESFRGRSSDFLMMFIYGSVLMTLFAFFADLIFLGQAFTLMLVYVWSRRNPDVRMNFFGALNFDAPYLPWVLLCCSVTLGNTVSVDLIGMAVGHFYYYLKDIFPNQPDGFDMLKTPNWLKRMMNEHTTELFDLPEMDRPGGFDWNDDPEMRNVV